MGIRQQVGNGAPWLWPGLPSSEGVADPGALSAPGVWSYRTRPRPTDTSLVSASSSSSWSTVARPCSSPMPRHELVACQAGSRAQWERRRLREPRRERRPTVASPAACDDETMSSTGTASAHAGTALVRLGGAGRQVRRRILLLVPGVRPCGSCRWRSWGRIRGSRPGEPCKGRAVRRPGLGGGRRRWWRPDWR